MKVIEFIGPPAIGKTTTAKRLIKLNECFMSEYKAIDKILFYRKNELDIRDKILYFFSKLVIKKKYKNIILNKASYKMKKLTFKENLKKYSSIIKVFNDNLFELNYLDEEQKLIVNCNYLHHLEKYVFLRENNINDIVVLDESIVHNNRGLKNEFCKSLTQFLPDYIISFNIDFKDYLPRRIGRKRRTLSDYKLDDEKLIERAKLEYQLAYDKEKNLKHNFENLIQIDASNNVNINIDIIYSAICKSASDLNKINER